MKEDVPQCFHCVEDVFYDLLYIKDRSESLVTPRFLTSLGVIGGASSFWGHMSVGGCLDHCPQGMIIVFVV